MRVRIKSQTVYKGTVLAFNQDVDVDEAVGRRWVDKGIAKRLVKATERKGDDDNGLSGVRDDGSAGDVSGDPGGVTPIGQSQDADKSERTRAAGDNGKRGQRKR